MSDNKIVILSRERQDIGTTWNLLPNATVFVHESEADAYRAKIKNEIVTHNKDRSTAIRNFIMEYYGEGTRIISFDDDIKAFYRITTLNGKNKLNKITGEEIINQYSAMLDRMQEKGYHLVGIAPNTNCLNYSKERHITYNNFICGSCYAVIVSDIRWDEQSDGKSDYDFTLQHIDRGMGVVRLNYLCSEYNYDTMSGGATAIRKGEWKKKAFDYIMKKWYPHVTPNTKRPNELILRYRKMK